MPKKTKKEKLLAQQHRTKLAPVAAASREVSASPLPSSSPMTFSLPATRVSKQAAAVAAPHEYALIKRDLVKTVFLTTAILIGEFLLASKLPR